MIEGKKILAVLPARGGSKGVPRKNIRNLAGKPLIAWTIEEAKKSKYIDKIILSSEDQEIIQVATEWGCEVPFVRPMELAKDETPGIDPVLHAIKNLQGYDYVVLLQVTSPLRTVEDIDGCIEQGMRLKAKACVSVTEPEKHPFWMYTLDEEGRMKPLNQAKTTYTRRQDMPQVFALNGAVYFADCGWLLESRSFLTEETVAFPMVKEHSLDIDTELDFRICELMVSSK